MNHKQKVRLSAIMTLILLLGIAAGLILYALKQNINLFYTPTEVMHATVHPEQIIRIGGYVKQHSVYYQAQGEAVNFIVTDRAEEIPVYFNGILPSLFREGQVVIITGTLNAHHLFIANEVLAKHDEKYMPKPLADQLNNKAKPHGS